MKKTLLILLILPVMSIAQKRTAGPVPLGGALGTPASGSLANCTGLPIGTGVSGLASNVATFLGTPSSANLRSAITDENGTGALLFSGMTTPDITTGFTVGGAGTTNKIIKGNGTNYVPSTETYAAPGTAGNHFVSDGTNWTAVNERNNWTSTIVTGSDFTTTSATLVNITGLVSGTLAVATLYEFESVMYVNSTTTAGVEIGIQQSGTGSGQIGVFTGTATNAAATGLAIGSNALNTASAACVLVNGDGQVTIRGFIKTGSTGSPTISMQILKLTSGTAKVYIGSVLRYRVAN